MEAQLIEILRRLNAVEDRLNRTEVIEIPIGGVYTPTLTGVANVDALVASECQYLQVGTTVLVSGQLSVDPTLTATVTRLRISLPVASNIGAASDLAGVINNGASTAATEEVGTVFGDAANDAGEIFFIANITTAHNIRFIFAYQVI